MASANGFGHLAGDLMSHAGRWPLGDHSDSECYHYGEWGAGDAHCLKVGSCHPAPLQCGRMADFLVIPVSCLVGKDRCF